MPSTNLEVVRRMYEANRSGPEEATVEIALALSDPDVEIRSRLTALEGETYRGPEGVRRYFADLADAWQEWRNDIEEIVELRDDAVLSRSVFRGIGRGSGAEVELRSSIAWVLSRGRVLKVYSYPTDSEALEAASI